MKGTDPCQRVLSNDCGQIPHPMACGPLLPLLRTFSDKALGYLQTISAVFGSDVERSMPHLCY